MRGWLGPGGRFLRPRLAAVLVTAGFVSGSLGAVMGIAAANAALAQGLNICGSSLSLAPGDSGTCSETISDTAAPTNTSTVNVTVVVSSVSTSGGGSPTATPPVATEALLDGTSSGLQVVITDLTTGSTFALGPVSCYTDSSKTTKATYPTAAYCASTSKPQRVASSVDNAKFSNTFQIKWEFPIGAGNPYQGAAATISLTPTFTGATGGAVKGASTTRGSTTPHGGVSGASTPATGAGLPLVLSRILIVAGLALLFSGLLVWRRKGHFARG